MNDQIVAQLLGLVLLVGVMPVAFAHMFGGSGWSGAVMRFYGRILRSLFALPFLLLGRLFTGAGASIKGGGKKRRP